MTDTAQILSLTTALIDSLGLRPYIGAAAIMILAITAFRLIFGRGGGGD